MFPEEARAKLNELIESHERITPAILVGCFDELAQEKIRCDQDDICVEAEAAKEYDFYLEKEEPLKMHLFLTREMSENGSEWQLVLDIAFRMNPYFEKYLPGGNFAGLWPNPFARKRTVWLSSFRGKERADRLINDVISHGEYLSYSVVFGEVPPDEDE